MMNKEKFTNSMLASLCVIAHASSLAPTTCPLGQKLCNGKCVCNSAMCCGIGKRYCYQAIACVNNNYYHRAC